MNVQVVTQETTFHSHVVNYQETEKSITPEITINIFPFQRDKSDKRAIVSMVLLKSKLTLP